MLGHPLAGAARVAARAPCFELVERWQLGAAEHERAQVVHLGRGRSADGAAVVVAREHLGAEPAPPAAASAVVLVAAAVAARRGSGAAEDAADDGGSRHA
jgi:hypothetical protein